RNFVFEAVPRELVADDILAGGRQSARRVTEEGHVVFQLRVGKPTAAPVVEDQVPLVPAALLVLVEDPAHHHERLAAVNAFGGDLDGRTVGGQVRDLAYPL